MTVATIEKKRDYSLVGESTRRAIETGLASAEWYHTDVPRKTMKELMQRSDGPAIRDTVIWMAALIGSAAGAIYFWGTWWCVPFFFVYGVLYGSSSDSRWHECGHGTAFRTRWMNDVVYQIASFMLMRNPVTWRWSHARHHTDTIIVGRDAEIAVMRPPDLLRTALAFTGCSTSAIRCRRCSATPSAICRRTRRATSPRWSSTRRSSPRAGMSPIYLATIALGALHAVVAAADADRPAAPLRHLAHGADRPAAAHRPRRQRHRSPAQHAARSI